MIKTVLSEVKESELGITLPHEHICVVNKHQLADFQNIIGKYDNTFSFYELINETYGNFVHAK